jgi:hypothetical protein
MNFALAITASALEMVVAPTGWAQGNLASVVELRLASLRACERGEMFVGLGILLGDPRGSQVPKQLLGCNTIYLNHANAAPTFSLQTI